MENKVIGLEFYKIVNSSLLEEISKAVISLRLDLIYTSEEISHEIINEMFVELNKTIKTYIDGQKETIIKLQKAD